MHPRVLVLLLALALAVTLGMPRTEGDGAQHAAEAPGTTASGAGSDSSDEPSDEDDGKSDEQEPEPAKPKGPNCRKVRCMALTFDDGPGLDTPRLLNILRKRKVKATFFLVGQMIDARPETARRIARGGHEIGVHSWSHANLMTQTPKWLDWQLVSTRRKIKKVTGITPTLSRPPYGATDLRVLKAQKRAGLAEVLWNIDTSDWKIRNARHVRQVAVDRARRNGVVLMHDIRPTTVDSVDAMIRSLRRRGYHLVTVSHLIGKPRAGRSYFDWREPSRILNPLPRDRRSPSAH